jgi:hypothetical protein
VRLLLGLIFFYAAPQQLFTPQPSWVQHLPVLQEMAQLPMQQGRVLLQNLPQVVQQPMQQPSVAAQPNPKEAKNVEPASSNEKMKNSSLSERRGSIVKSIDRLASSIASGKASTAASASSASMMPMLMMMQM